MGIRKIQTLAFAQIFIYLIRMVDDYTHNCIMITKITTMTMCNNTTKARFILHNAGHDAQ